MGSGSSKPTSADLYHDEPIAQVASTAVQPDIEGLMQIRGNTPPDRAGSPATSSLDPHSLMNHGVELGGRDSLPGATHRSRHTSNQNRGGGNRRSSLTGPEGSRSPHAARLDTPPHETQEKPIQNCRLFLRGKCRYGDRCRDRHVAMGSASIRSSPYGLGTPECPTSHKANPHRTTADTRHNVSDDIDDYIASVLTKHATSETVGTGPGLSHGNQRESVVYHPNPILAPVRQQKPKQPPHNQASNRSTRTPNASARKTRQIVTSKLPLPGDSIPTSVERSKTGSHSGNPPVKVKGKILTNCDAWKAGACPNGDDCRFVHDPEVQAAERSRLAKLAEEEAAKTTDHLVFSSTKATFGAGASVIRVITGFETCRVVVKNLPLNATKTQVVDFFTQPGFDPSRFQVVALHRGAGGKRQEAIVIFDDIEDGKNAVGGLDDIEFGNEKVKLEVMSKQGEMGASNSNRDPELLTVTWPAPSIRVVATYSSIEEAQAKVRDLDKRLCLGRKVRVALNQRPPNFPSSLCFNPAAVTISGLPVGAVVEKIEEFSGSSAIRYLKPRQYDLETSTNQFQEHIKLIAGGGDEMTNFEAELNPTESGMVSARIRFNSWERAKHVYDSLENKTMHFFGGAKCYVSLPDPLRYSISVPFQQYKAQESVFKSLADSSQKDMTTGARVRLLGGQSGKFARVEVSGSDKKAVGSLKVRVEQLVAGEKLQFWDRFFWSEEGESFLASVFDKTNAFIRCDKRLNALKAFGEPRAVEEAKSMINAKVELLASSEFSVCLKRASIRFFVDGGAAVLKEIVGEDNVTLDVTSNPCKITIRGGEAARHTLRKLVDESLAPASTSGHEMSIKEANCPICFTEIDHPFRLACGHAYCDGCMRHFLTTACDTKLFPLCCMGDEGKCGKPLPIATIERFLLPAEVKKLLEVAFLEHLDRHPQEFKYCPTADCLQIYRIEEGKGVVQCPSCFASTCVSCSGDHEGFSCEEWKLHRDPEAQERLLMGWAEGNENVRKCPKCEVLIEKNGGCNHMTCSRCKSHICWKCMEICEGGMIYEHLELFHGGAFDYDV